MRPRLLCGTQWRMRRKWLGRYSNFHWTRQERMPGWGEASPTMPVWFCLALRHLLLKLRPWQPTASNNSSSRRPLGRTRVSSLQWPRVTLNRNIASDASGASADASSGAQAQNRSLPRAQGTRVDSPGPSAQELASRRGTYRRCVRKRP
jgi:hypothetical protein